MRHAIAAIFISLSLLAGCAAELQEEDGSNSLTEASSSALITDSTAHLTWVNSWLTSATNTPSIVVENIYDTSPSYITSTNGQLANRTVCSSLVVQLFKNAHGLTDSDFRNSFPRRTDLADHCDVGSTKYSGGDYDGKTYGTIGPNTEQFNYKIEHCADTGPIKFDKITRVADMIGGDILAVRYTDTSGGATGHNMIIRSAPTTTPHNASGDPVTLPAGPADSVAWAVEIVDSTSGKHGNGSLLPDTRPGAVNDTGGVGVGWFIVYADETSGEIVASRWSVNAADLFTIAEHPITVGRLKVQAP